MRWGNISHHTLYPARQIRIWIKKKKPHICPMHTLFNKRGGGLFIALMLIGLAGGSVSARNAEAEKLLSQVERHYFIENEG